MSKKFKIGDRVIFCNGFEEDTGTIEEEYEDWHGRWWVRWDSNDKLLSCGEHNLEHLGSQKFTIQEINEYLKAGDAAEIYEDAVVSFLKNRTERLTELKSQLQKIQEEIASIEGK